MAINNDLTIDERRKQKEEELWRALAELTPSKKKIVKNTVEDAAFKAVQLEELHIVLQDEGVIEEYQNGANQSGRKVSSVFQAYSTLEKSYQSQVKILLDALPKELPKSENDDGFESFVIERD
ncbi:hypothetical protein MKX73_19720 [Solibacillus sp. FSL W7-1436]|uniref:hypothetical protein n=1 Tax=Solibacillus sp. FSL W7-1436 TaxID=2921705 RepID=UPI0030FA02DA